MWKLFAQMVTPILRFKKKIEFHEFDNKTNRHNIKIYLKMIYTQWYQCKMGSNGHMPI